MLLTVKNFGAPDASQSLILQHMYRVGHIPRNKVKEAREGFEGEIEIHVFFYKHGVFQSEARICLSFS